VWREKPANGRPMAYRAAYPRSCVFKLRDECSDMQGNRSREGVGLSLEALPNC
jgi:hypothetical protein